MNKLLVIGSGGHARTVLELASLNGFHSVGVIDVNYQGVEENIMGIPVIGGLDRLNEFDFNEVQAFIAIGDNLERNQCFQDVQRRAYEIPNLIHPQAIVSRSAEFESGIAVCAGCIINPMVSIANGSIINTGSIIDHETKLGSFVHIGPGANVAGRVEIGANTFVGIGASVADKISIGANVVVGAGSVVLKDIPNDSKVVGVSKILES